MAYTDYKWWFVRRNDDGYITEAAVRFYEGEYVEEENDAKEKVQVYRRTKRIDPGASEIKALATWTKANDPSGNPVAKFTAKDFGKIKTDDELREFCDGQIDKLKTKYTVIDAQRLSAVKS